MRLKGLTSQLSNWAQSWIGQPAGSPRPIPLHLWQKTLAELPFLTSLSDAEQQRLRSLSESFLSHKEFFGANGQEITDAIGTTIAAQACLVILHMTPFDTPAAKALALYQHFVGIVVHPDEVLAQREWIDEAGVVHQSREPLTGETSEDGPVMLSWSEVLRAGAAAAEGTNVVIHEFVHKLAMQGLRSEEFMADCPALPVDFLGRSTTKEAVAQWFSILVPAFESFQDQVAMAERFGQAEPWLDAYGATSLEEFFPVTCEAYFSNRARFAQEFPNLMAPYDALFRPFE